LYKSLVEQGIKCIIDDRNGYSIGNKIKDVYTLGTPYIAILGNNSTDGTIEIEETKSGNKKVIDLKDIYELLK